MSKIFISYNRQSEASVGALAEDIKAMGHTVWFDQELSGGQDWWNQILDAIRNCELLILVLAPETLESIACKREYSYANDLGKPILPVLGTDGVSTNLLPPALSQIQLIDYRKQNRAAALSLAKALNTISTPNPLPNPLPDPPEAPLSYLNKLTEQIGTASILNIEKQSALVVELKRGLRNPETTADTRTLLNKLRKRSDLFARIMEEIDELLERKKTGSSTSEIRSAPEPKQAPKLVADIEGKSKEEQDRNAVVQRTTKETKTFKNDTGMEFVLITAGSFTMGSGPAGQDIEQPSHTVEISRPFYLQKTEVTQGQWKEVTENSPLDFSYTAIPHEESETEDRWRAERPVDVNECCDDCPAENVSWEDAHKFINILNDMEGVEAYRLPTEAEWEYAARAGTTSWQDTPTFKTLNFLDNSYL